VQPQFAEQFGLGWKEALASGKVSSHFASITPASSSSSFLPSTQVYNAKDACAKLGLSADEMDSQWAICKKNKKLVKFGGGFYCGLVDNGTAEPIYVFNGFFMAMRNKFTAPGLSIYYYVVEWDEKDLSWADFRGEVLGPTDPKEAPAGSLRGVIMKNWKSLGLDYEPNVGDNGMHASASPFEGLAERNNWLSEPLARIPFGKALLDAGIPEKWIKDGINDPQVDLGTGKMGSLFDAVEDMDSDACLGKLKILAPKGGLDFFMLFLAAGVLISFTVFGYAQEAVTRTNFGEEKERFHFSTFLVLLQSVGNAAVAACLLIFYAAKEGKSVSFTGGTGVTTWLKVALAYFGAHEMGLMALGYITFPMQVVCKSCKAIPVMVGEMMMGEQHSRAKKLSVVFMCAGVASFTLFGKAKKGAEFAFDANLLIGLGLVLGALICDGYYGPIQNQIKRASNGQVGPYHLMFNMNLWQGIFALAMCLVEGEIAHATAFVVKHPEVLKLLIGFSVAMAVGQVFIFQLQAGYGALTVTLTTTLRKLISVVFSVFMFGHSMAPAQWVAVGIVFFSNDLSKRLSTMLGPEAEKKKKE